MYIYIYINILTSFLYYSLINIFENIESWFDGLHEIRCFIGQFDFIQIIYRHLQVVVIVILCNYYCIMLIIWALILMNFNILQLRLYSNRLSTGYCRAPCYY